MHLHSHAHSHSVNDLTYVTSFVPFFLLSFSDNPLGVFFLTQDCRTSNITIEAFDLRQLGAGAGAGGKHGRIAAAGATLVDSIPYASSSSSKNSSDKKKHTSIMGGGGGARSPGGGVLLPPPAVILPPPSSSSSSSGGMPSPRLPPPGEVKKKSSTASTTHMKMSALDKAASRRVVSKNSKAEKEAAAAAVAASKRSATGDGKQPQQPQRKHNTMMGRIGASVRKLSTGKVYISHKSEVIRRQINHVRHPCHVHA